MSKSCSLVLGPHLFHHQAHRVVKGEDTWVQLTDLKHSGTEYSLFAVFDGHGSKDAAKFAAKHLHEKLDAALCKPSADSSDENVKNGNVAVSPTEADTCTSQEKLIAKMPSALRDAFMSLDASFRLTGQDSGTTATVVAIIGWEVVVANVGDSLVYLDTGSEVLRGSANHRIEDSKEERDRIKAAGGCIARAAIDDTPAGPIRAWPGGLAMGRTIGDPSAGDFIFADPEVHQFTWPLAGGRLVIASDGLWDAVSPKTVCHHIRGMGATQATKALVKLVAQKGKATRDDVTVVVVDALSHEDGGKVPLCISKTFSTSLSRTLSSMSTASASSRQGDANESVRIRRPIDEVDCQWRESLRERRAAMSQHLQWMQELVAETERRLMERAESCPVGESNLQVEFIRYEGSTEDEVQEGGDGWQSVSHRRKSQEPEWQVQGKNRHRRSTSDVHHARHNDRRGKGRGRGGGYREFRGRTQSVDLGWKARGDGQGFVGGSGKRGAEFEQKGKDHNIVIQSEGSVIEISMGGGEPVKTGSNGTGRSSGGYKHYEKNEDGVGNGNGDCNGNGNRVHRPTGSLTEGQFQGKSGRGGGRGQRGGRRNGEHRKSFSQGSMEWGRRGGHRYGRGRGKPEYFRNYEDAVKA
ncbi:hypothetical protein BSKO_09266 [Bryopsis sp. KO-2023]|nr:hypothetical protein BSKO_09266 [Bryopsis sp. KO-2023]